MFSSQGLKMRASVHREQSGLERDLGFPELSGEPATGRGHGQPNPRSFWTRAPSVTSTLGRVTCV